MEKPDVAQEVERTAQRYQTDAYASTYKNEYEDGWKLRNLRSRLVASAEIHAVTKALDGARLEGAILDIPCGTGKLGGTLSRYPVRITAADLSAEMMKLAREEYDEEKIDDFIVCDAAELPMEDGSLDSVICLRLTQRLPVEFRARVLAEFRRVVTRSLIVSYSVSSPWHDLRGRLRWLYDRSDPTLFPARRREIEQELNQAGFSIVDVRKVLPAISSQIIVTARPI
ncbi:MAG TPA: class I SAM-dependent methyltransferase [Gammaproteobacteria bacterium]